MAYPREEIDRVRDATDLAELAAEVTKVKRSGRSVMAVCPFHQEKTPSLSIDAARGLYHCFGCGKSGDVFSWVQETQSTDFVGALELLARRSGITLTQSAGDAKRRSQREELVAVTEDAVAFYLDRLKQGPDAGSARAYLRGRGYDADVVDEYRIGYSPSEWDTLSRHLASAGIKEKVIVAAGLAVRGRQGRLVDRFRGRVMFPIFDLRGDAVGFGARLLDGEGPKYLNSPDTPIYHKSRLLYGLNWAKSQMVRSGEAVVVEGYTDVIAFQLAGAPIAVATCGTALGPEHLDLLRRFTDRIVLAFDADAAGSGAAQRGFDLATPGDLDLRVALLPPGRDPADLVHDGEVDSLLKSVAESTPLMQFRLERELDRFDLTEPEARARAVGAAAAIVAQHPDPVARHEYAVQLVRSTGVELDLVLDTVARQRPRRESAPPSPPPEKLTGTDKAERELLRLVLANDAGLRGLEFDVEVLSRTEHREAFELLWPAVEPLAPGEPPELGSLVSDGDDPVRRMLGELALVDRPLPEAADLVITLKVAVLERRINERRRELEQLDADAEPEKYSTVFTELIALETERRELRGGA